MPGNRIVIFKGVARIGLIEKVILKQKSEESQGVNQVGYLGEACSMQEEETFQRT